MVVCSVQKQAECIDALRATVVDSARVVKAMGGPARTTVGRRLRAPPYTLITEMADIFLPHLVEPTNAHIAAFGGAGTKRTVLKSGVASSQRVAKWRPVSNADELFDYMLQRVIDDYKPSISSKGRLMTKERVGVLRAHVDGEPDHLQVAFSEAVLSVVTQLGGVMATDDILLRYAAAGSLTISIPSKPARYGLYADGSVTSLKVTGKPLYVGLLWHTRPGDKQPPALAAQNLHARISRLRTRYGYVAMPLVSVLDRAYTTMDMVVSAYKLSPPMLVTGAIRKSCLPDGVVQLLSTNLGAGKHRIIHVVESDVPILISATHYANGNILFVVSTAHARSRADAGVRLTAPPTLTLDEFNLVKSVLKPELVNSALRKRGVVVPAGGDDRALAVLLDLELRNVYGTRQAPESDRVAHVETRSTSTSSSARPRSGRQDRKKVSTKRKRSTAQLFDDAAARGQLCAQRDMRDGVTVAGSRSRRSAASQVDWSVRESYNGLTARKLQGMMRDEGVQLRTGVTSTKSNLIDALVRHFQPRQRVSDEAKVLAVHNSQHEGASPLHDFYKDNFNGVDRGDRTLSDLGDQRRVCDTSDRRVPHFVALTLLNMLLVNFVSIYQELYAQDPPYNPPSLRDTLVMIYNDRLTARRARHANAD